MTKFEFNKRNKSEEIQRINSKTKVNTKIEKYVIREINRI